MKNLIKILLLTVIISSCEKSTESLNPFNGTRWETPLKDNRPISDDKTKMHIDFISQDSVLFGEFIIFNDNNVFDIKRTTNYNFNPETKIVNMEFRNEVGEINQIINFTVISDSTAHVLIYYPVTADFDIDCIFYLK